VSEGEITTTRLLAMKRRGEKIAVLTCYDASFAQLLEAAGVEVILVGDSLGMVIQGHPSTLPVRVADMVYHTGCVTRGRRRALVVADLPFMSYVTPAQTLGTAARLMKQGGAHMVKLEGGHAQVENVHYLTTQGIPVCAHLGLLPQSVHQLGGYRVQGRDPQDAERIRADALALEAAGAGMLVLECVPSSLGATIAQQLSIPVIGIGAGPGCDGQVLVLYDLLGATPGKPARFVRNFLATGGDLAGAVAAYVSAVKDGSFPAAEHSFE
jgi:3-methyl-2-oxobutanoate hydroxymethyltransferase